MKTIYNIYERLNLYNGLLAGLEDTLEKGETIVQDILRTFKERIIKIVTLAGHMSDSESLVFREMIEDGIKSAGTTLAHCYIDKTIRDNLIVKSKRKLTIEDFRGFPDNKKEYSFACSSAHVYLDYQIGADVGVDGLYKQAISNRGKFVYGDHNVKCIQLGNAIIYQQGGYFYIKFSNMFRFVVEISDRGTSANRIDLVKFK